MTPLRLDKHLRCVKREAGEEWFAYSTEFSTWYPITADEAAWIISMIQNLDVDKLIDWCRANCYSDVGYDPDTNEVLFEKENTEC